MVPARVQGPCVFALLANACEPGKSLKNGFLCLPAVLGRFVFALNVFCKEKYGLHHSVSDYWVYEFAKVREASDNWLTLCLHEQKNNRKTMCYSCRISNGLFMQPPADMGVYT
jgi:hypothetical protein